DATVTYQGLRTEDGKTYEVLSVTPKGGFAEEIWYDPATTLPARTIVDYGRIKNITNISDYRSVDGLMLPATAQMTYRYEARDSYGHVQSFSSHDEVFKDTRIETAAPQAAERFAMPPMTVSDVSLPGGETTLPFIMRNFWLFVDVRLNGQGPFRMMLDSGGYNTLSPGVLADIGATVTGKVPQSSDIPGTRPLRYTRVSSVEIGGATLAQQDFRVGEISNPFVRNGMIGYELFERFTTVLDYPNRRITLRLPQNGRQNNDTGAAGDSSLPLEFDDTKPETACRIDDTDASCIVDTGAALALLLTGPFTKANAGIQPPWFAGAYTQVYGSDSASEVRYGPLSSFHLGPFKLSNLDTLFTTAGNGALAFYPSALVGNRVWQNFIVVFDYANSALRLMRTATFPSN
ncbi:MAG TPA: retropepsin-like aspartic protease, partial [Candidatus Binataceae bacterium]|nr:retropepsin-like aspartic protease [Candidatus Binataceae bacterium]